LSIYKKNCNNFIVVSLHTFSPTFLVDRLPTNVSGDRRKVAESAGGRPGQEEIPRAVGLDCWPVLLPHPQEDSPSPGGRSLFLRQQCDTAHQCYDGHIVPGALQVFIRERLNNLFVLFILFLLDLSIGWNPSI